MAGVGTGFCQAGDTISVITTKQGLSINSVNDIMFDREGFLWAATSDGLQRYDGYGFKTFKKIPSDPVSLGENTCRHLFEDAGGNIWVGHNAVVSVKRKNDGRFVIIKFNNFYNALKPFAEDSSFVWIAGADHFFLVNKRTLTVEHDFTFVNNIFPDSLTAFIARSPVRFGGIFNYFIKANEAAFKKYHITEEDPGIINKNGYSLIHFLSGTTISPFNLKGKNYSIAASARLSTFEFLFLLMNQGAYIYNVKTGNLQKHRLSDLIEKYIDYSLITGMVIDSGKNIWFSQSGKGGIVCIKNVQHPFRTFIKSDKDVLIYGLQNDFQNNVYVAAYRKFINAYDEKGSIIKTFGSPALETKPGSKLPFTIRALKMINEKEMLLLSTNGLVFLLNTKTSSVQNLTNSIPKSKILITDIFDLQIFQQDTNTFIFNYFNQLIKLSYKNNKPLLEAACKISGGAIITAFYPLGANNWLLGTANGLYNISSAGLVPLKDVWGVHVKSISKDMLNRFWIATEAGIFIIRNGKLIKALTEQNGLSSSFIYGILFDKKNHAWCSSNKGLMRIDTSFNVKAFNQSSGLLNDEFNTNGFLKHPNGNFYFAGLYGIDYFNPDEFQEDTTSSAIRLADLKVNYTNYSFSINPEGSISFSAPFDKNNLSLSFSVMDFYNPSVNQFSYYLKGYQSDWSLPATKNEVNYILPPGEYTLLVKGANHNGVWTIKPLLIKISIVPAWYQTDLFKWGIVFLGILIIGAGLYYLNKVKYRKKLTVLKMQQQIQEEKERLSRDLHDNLGSQMALLSNNIESLDINFKRQLGVQANIEKVKASSRQLLQTLRETIWILNKEQVTAQEFFDKLVDYTHRYLQSFREIQLNVREDFLGKKMLNSNEALQLFRICQEAIANSCKYAGTENIILHGIEEQNSFQLTIEDSGKGFDVNNVPDEGHYGLKNMQKRAQSINAGFEINAIKDKGVSISIKI
jgi:signal transduction histidine kinase